MTYVAKLRSDLLQREGKLLDQIATLTAQLERCQSELPFVTAALEVLPLGTIVQLELQDKARNAGGPKLGEGHKVDDVPHPRKRPTRLKAEQVRDWICDEVKDQEFTAAELQVRFGVSSGTARNRIQDLLGRKIIVPGARPGRWVYNSEIPAGPSTRPRGERLLGVPTARNAGTAVPGTGVPRGPAGTPGALRRQQNKAARVKMPKRTGVRP